MDAKTTYTIMPEYGDAYAWIKYSDEKSSYVGPNYASSQYWHGHHPISAQLQADFFHSIPLIPSSIEMRSMAVFGVPARTRNTGTSGVKIWKQYPT